MCMCFYAIVFVQGISLMRKSTVTAYMCLVDSVAESKEHSLFSLVEIPYIVQNEECVNVTPTLT
jgi:hypothetical protein